MLHILFVILKIIGMILAAAAGILLLVLLCALFVPVRYCILADGKLGGEEPVHVDIKVTWLLHIVNAAFSYSKTARLRVRFFCFTLFDTSRKKEGKKKKKIKEKRPKTGKNGPDEKEEEIQNKEKKLGEIQAGGEEEKKEALISGDAKGDGIQEEGALEEGQEGESGKGKETNGIRGILDAILGFLKKIYEAVKNIEYTIEKIYGKIKNVMENIRYYTNIMKGEVFQNVFRNAKGQLFWIFRMLKPKKCRIDLKAGTGDPFTTGQIMAVYGMLYPFIGNHVSIQTDFENKVMEGDLLIKGKVVAVIFLVAAIRMVLDRNIWKLLKLLKKGGYINGGE